MFRPFVFTAAAVIALALASVAGTIKMQPTTTVAAEKANNTSAAITFTGQTNGNAGPGNVSKVATRTLLYSGSTTKIYAHFMGWFGQSNHMDVGYTSDDASQVKKQVTDALSRGLAGFILDWYGPNNIMPNSTAFTLKHEAESRGGQFVFGITYDGGALGTCANTAGCNLTNQAISDLTYSYNNFEISPAYMKLNGRPVVTFFDPDRYGTLDWASIKAAVPGNPIFVFRNSGGFTHAQSEGSFSWVGGNFTTHYPDLSYLDNFYSTSLQYPAKHAFSSAYKGFNDTLASWGQNRIVYQQCGQTWLRTWREAGKYFNSSTQLESFQIVTWNDYEEGTEFESGIDNCLSVGASLSGTATALVSGTTLNFSPQGTGSESATVDHYRVFVSSDGSNLMKLTDMPVGSRSLNLGSYSFGPGTYYFFVKMWGRASIRNKMSGSVKYTVTGVAIKSPQAGATVSNSVHVAATATAVWTPVKVMQIYLDGVKVYEVLNSSTLDHYITASSGKWHQIVVQAYDTNYYHFNSSISVYVP
jgi:hypothetical protein